ncbi:MAG: substrate-binding periplasmic protein [Pseudomonadales bacterium]
MRLLLVLATLLFAQLSAAQTLILNISEKGYPPYLLSEPTEQGRGVLYDVLELITQRHNIQIEIISVPRKRVEQLLTAGSFDATMAAREWINSPQRFLFSDPIMQSQDVLFSKRETPLYFERVEDLFGERIATRLGYKYPLIDPYTVQQKIHRMDALTTEAMLKMVLADRADATIVNRAAGQWLIANQPHLQNKFYITDKPINVFDLRLMFNQQWGDFVETFNRELAQMAASGQLQQIIERYR